MAMLLFSLKNDFELNWNFFGDTMHIQKNCKLIMNIFLGIYFFFIKKK